MKRRKKPEVLDALNDPVGLKRALVLAGKFGRSASTVFKAAAEQLKRKQRDVQQAKGPEAAPLHRREHDADG
jgi:hypothetical protein